jgi:ubiquitin-activating enzyme E1 C
MVFNDTDGIYTYVYAQERNENCLACSRRPQRLEFAGSARLQELVDHLVSSPDLQMKAPGLTTSVGGKNKTLYMQSVPSIEAATKKNLKLSLAELGLVDGSELVVADSTTPNSIVFTLRLK